MGRRITRKQLKQDEFVTLFDSIMHWLSDNWRPLVAGLGAVVVVILLWGVVSWWSGSRSENAAEALYQALRTYGGGGEPGGQPGVADVAAAEEQFQLVIDRYGRSSQADVARLYLAQIHLGRGEVDRARELLLKVSERGSDDALRRVAAIDLIRLRVAAGQGAEVAKELEAMVAGQDRRLPPDAALYELGEVLQQEQQIERARESFRKLVEEFPQSPYREPAMQKLRELG